MKRAGFYVVERVEELVEHKKINAEVVFNARHAIFEGHFPGNPVVPGVCLLFILKDIINTTLLKNRYLFHANNIKFSASIDPRVHEKVSFEIAYKELENGMLRISNSVFQNEIVFMKFKGDFK